MPRKKKDIKVEEKNKEPVKFAQERKDLILRLLKNSPLPINWICDSVIVKRVFLYWPYPEFWSEFELPPFLKDIDNLKVLAGKWGLNYIQKSFNAWKFNNQEVRAASQLGDKIGPDIQIVKTKKTLKDFIG